MANRWVRKAVLGMITVMILSTVVIPGLQGASSITKQVMDDHQDVALLMDGNSVVCGYVNDSVTGDPLMGVYVNLGWQDSQGHYWNNNTYTDAAGFYLFHTGAVTFYLYFSFQYFFSEQSPTESVGENEIFWYNLSLIPVPPRTVHFSGFITDNVTGDPLGGDEVYLDWRDDQGHYWYNYTYSNESGYYYLGGIPGRTRIFAYYNNHFSYSSDDIFTENNSLVWLNISLIPYPPASAVLCGYITDAQNGDPLPYASVHINSMTDHGQWGNYTNADASGFFRVGSISGVVDFSANKQGYSSAFIDNMVIQENETRWVNVSLAYLPVETSYVQGYVVDSETSAVVRNAFVRFDWKDDLGHFYSNYTFTDQIGYYRISMPKGDVQFLFTGNGYGNQEVPWFQIDEYAQYWLNASISPQITLTFTKPLPGITINNHLLFPRLSKMLTRFLHLSRIWALGPLEIDVNVTNASLGCNRVDFYINGKLMGYDADAPYSFTWKGLGHVLPSVVQAVAYDNAGPCRSASIKVWRL